MYPPLFIYIVNIIYSPRVAIQMIVKAKNFDMQERILIVTRLDVVGL
jgi:hypothetical protein